MSLVYNILITRPYSWLNIILVGLIADVLSRSTLIFDVYLLADVLFAFLVWVTGMSFTEYWHKITDSRVNIPKYLLIVLLFLLIAFCAIRNPLTILIILFLVFSNTIYSFKMKPWKLSHLGFIFRGFLESMIFISVFLFYNNYNIVSQFPFIIALFVITDSRNLIGDIRDMWTDKFTLPKKYGELFAYRISLFLLLLGILLIHDVLITLPLIVTFIIIIFRQKRKYSYVIHKFMVISTIFFLFNYLSSIVGMNLILTNLMFFAVALNFTYDYVPRKTNHYYVLVQK